MKRILILGGGFGGLRVALILDRKLASLELKERYELVLVDRNAYHTYTPILYEIASAPEHIEESSLRKKAGYDIRDLLAGTCARFIEDRIKNLDLVGGDAHFERGEELPCDYVVLAPGSETNYFGIPGLKEHSLALKTLEDALAIRKTLWKLLENAGGREIRLAVGGAGPTGIEIASEFSFIAKSAKDKKISVTLLEAMPRVLPGLDDSVAKKIEARLRTIGVEVVCGDPIASVSKNAITTKSGASFPFDLFVWTGGVKAPDFLAELAVKTESRGKLEVESGMQCLSESPDLKLRSRVYALGDSVCFLDPETKKPIPGAARAAISQASVVAANVIEDIKTDEKLSGVSAHKVFRPMHYPYVIPASGKYAVAKVGPVVLAGFSGWLLKLAVHFNYLLSIMSPWRALRVWLGALKMGAFRKA